MPPNRTAPKSEGLANPKEPDFTRAANRKDAAPKSEPEAEFQQVVGQDDVTRFDKPKENRKKNKDRKKGQKKEDGNNARQRTQPSLPDAAKPKPQAANKAKGGGSNKKNKPQRTARPLQKPILKTNPQE